ncbi:DUF3261 domain-containing protein [Rosenbergiella collisarenosi]|uniref:DUF3261 domain-containing protein n=1 Tax=Rosenbergiella collisarenosi TaxID=1544695 RepID=UPI001BD93168|nr:DUF3261 domain-containing protein [Rosenbergiella collisarenosi]MBT0719691.1 DUF3261 domain-containing protein [Rosenbergiella collisarenosi]
MKLRHIFGLCLLLLLGGCQHQTPQVAQPTAWLKPGTKVTLPRPSLDTPIRSQQMLTGRFNGQQQSLVIMLDANQQQLRLVGLSPVGIRLFMLTYDDKGIHTEQSIVVPHLPPASQVLADVMLSFYPVSRWQSNLPTGWRLRDVENTRQLTDSKGQVIMEVHYQQFDAQRLPISLEQRAFHYQISINYLDK